MRISVPVRNSALDSFDSTFNSGVLEFRTGAQPAEARDAPVGTVIISVPVPADAFGAASAGTKAKAGTWEDTSADASGTPTWARLRTAGDAGTQNDTDPRMDFSVGQGSGEISFNNTTVVAGQPFTLDTLVITAPAG